MKMISRLRPLPALILCIASVGLAQAQEEPITFKVRGSNPGGGGAYTGEVALTKLAEATAKVRWTIGAKKEVTEGIALKTESAAGAAYGGKGLYALAVYELKGQSILGTWTLAAKPEESGTYELKGSDFKGKLPLAAGEGSVTFTPSKSGVYAVAWDLESGHFDGIGVRVGDALVAASGDMKAGFGVAGYAPPKDGVIEGIWATPQAKGTGKESWIMAKGGESAAETAKSPGKPAATVDGKSVKFGEETYFLKNNLSDPGKPTSELREYLRKGEDWDGYRKMIALRKFTVNATAAELAKSTLETVKKEHPDSYIKELAMEDDAATVFFIIVVGKNAELNLWHYVKVEGGVAGAQLVMRNKAPYETQAKFKAEQDKQWDSWLKDIAALGAQASDLMDATAGAGTVDKADAAAPTPKQKPKAGKEKEEVSPELVKAVKVDMDKCVALAQKFIGHLQAGETEKAAALMSDDAFKKMSREEFVQALEKSNTLLGEMKDYKPDKSATDFGVKDGVMTFTLQADAEYAKAKARETLRFIRNAKGGIDFMDYVRTVKE